ncbi:hypothetical protein GA787_003101 [Vibrio metschnikovii]|nr:hypothetical protein [Vibrio metschnikovii]
MPIRFISTKLIINLWFLVTLILVSNNALSDVFNVNAEYKPATYDSEYGVDNFKNTDKCNFQYPYPSGHLCSITYDNEYIFQLPVVANRTPSIGGNRDKPIFMKVKPKKIILTSTLNGEQHEMELIPTIVGLEVSGFVGFSTVQEIGLAMNDTLGGDCTTDNAKGSGGWGSDFRILKMYRVKGNTMSSGCYAGFEGNSQNGATLRVLQFLLAFRLKTPNPLKMKNGDYTGRLDLLISPNGDIDLGNGSYSASHTINFNLSVKHQIKVDFPQSSREITLKPNDGWWAGGKNTELSNDITYSLWASSNVNVYLRCQYKFNDACGIKNKKNHLVGLDVFNVTEGNKKTLLTEQQPELIKVTNPLIGQKSQILFRVNNDSVTRMLQYPGSVYSGDVTFIYDAEL